MAQTDFTRLVTALREADNVARDVSRTTVDGGTCNLDSVMLYVPRWKTETVHAAAKAAGIHVTKTKWFGKVCYFVGFSALGQAYARERGTQAALKVMREHGMKVNYYSQMD